MMSWPGSSFKIPRRTLCCITVDPDGDPLYDTSGDGTPPIQPL
jgi:hypothetical protein